MKFLAVVLSCSVMTNCFADGAEKVLPISTLNAQRNAYDGKELVLRGYLVLGPESTYVVTRPGYDGDYWADDSGCLSLLNSGDHNNREAALKGRYVEISGVFHVDTDSYGVSFSQCGSTGLDLGGNVDASIKVLGKP